MAKINHHNFVDTINDMLSEAKSRGVILLESQGDKWEGNTIQINNREMGNFGTCGYLGLELHPKIIQRTKEYAENFGVQFSISRSYVTSKGNHELEDLLSSVFSGKPVITFTSTTMAHLSVLPIVVGYNDAILLDQQSHISIQNAAQLMVPKGVLVDVIRHSSMEMLEHKIKSNYDKYDRIWYMIDGVYSMFGDIAPIAEINAMMAKYPKLHLYVDDAHGMSWYGKNGSGRLFEYTTINEKTIYITTMAKGFGTMGGIGVFPDISWYNKISMHGGPLAYSHPIPPPMLGAAIASAELHLSPEIIELQKSLKSKIDFANELFSKTDIPILSNPETPIYFIGTGQPSVGYNLNKRIIDEGFYINIGMFPAVPVKNTGLRFTITNHNSFAQIKDFVSAIIHHYPKALEEEHKTMDDVRKAFKLKTVDKQLEISSSNTITQFVYNSITEIKKEVWNSCFEDKGNFDWDALLTLEKSFSNNELPEENWKFYYIIMKDDCDKIILATYFTSGIFKDDLLSPAMVSRQIEEKRKTEPFYLCSTTLTLGSLFTEGDHLFYEREHPLCTEALNMLTKVAFEIQEKEDANNVIMRDFQETDLKVAEEFHKEGFFKFNMPNSNVIENLPISIEAFYNNLNGKNKKHLRHDVIEDWNVLSYEVKSQLSEKEISIAYQLYENVANENLAINIHKYPKKVFKQMQLNDNWEFLCLSHQEKLVAIGCCYKGRKSYSSVVLGMDYSNNKELKTYKKMLYFAVKRAIELGKDKIYMGLSADLEKRKLGATSYSKVAYISNKDSFNLEQIELFSNSKMQL